MTDEEILAIAHRTATVYRHRSGPESPSYGFVNHTILDFARKIEQAATAATLERCAQAVLNLDKEKWFPSQRDFAVACVDAIRKGE